MNNNNQPYKPVNWLHLTSIACADNMAVEASISENSGRVKMSFGRFDDGKFGYTHESLKALFFNDRAIERVREYLTQVETEVNEIRAVKKAGKELEKQQAKLIKKQALAAETLSVLTPDQVAQIAAAMGLTVTKKPA